MSEIAVRTINGRILVVDDEPANVRLLERMLGLARCPDVVSTTDPRRVVELCAQISPDAILLDLNMPYCDGLTVLARLRERYPCRVAMPILVLTADHLPERRHAALQAGATDFLTKPFDALELVLRLGNHLVSQRLQREIVANSLLLETRVAERTRHLEEAQVEMIERLAVATELRDDDTGGHIDRVAETTAGIAERMGLPAPEVEMLRRAVRLHDVGKIAIPDRILLKEDGLTPEEFDVIKEHALMGSRILAGSRFALLKCAEQIARSHHERWDGTGYPDGLEGEAIPLPARIAAVADVYDALTNSRPYKQAWRKEAAFAEIQRQAGTHFDPDVVLAFTRLHAESEPQPLRRAA